MAYTQTQAHVQTVYLKTYPHRAACRQSDGLFYVGLFDLAKRKNARLRRGLARRETDPTFTSTNPGSLYIYKKKSINLSVTAKRRKISGFINGVKHKNHE